MTDQNHAKRPGAQSSVAPGVFTQQQFSGAFAYRFSGFTVACANVYRLAGLGRMQIDAQGNVTGAQRSSITALHGQGAKLQTGVFSVAGTLAMQNDGSGSAKLTFTKDSGSGRGVKGEFNAIAAGSTDRIWPVSSGGVVLNDSGQPTDEQADELVDVEVIRMTTA